MVEEMNSESPQIPLSDPDVDNTISHNTESLETSVPPEKNPDPESSAHIKDKKGSERRSLRLTILRWLVVRGTCSVSELTRLCDLDEKGKNKYSYIWRQMDYLKKKGYIEKKIHFGANDPHKGQGPCYSIINNLRVISAIYHDPEFKELLFDIRTHSDWISEVILNERFDFVNKATRRIVKTMLTKSVIFFELSLEYQISNHLLLLMKRLFFEPRMTSSETGQVDDELYQFYLTRVAVFDLFIHCMFKENFEKMVRLEMSEEDQDFLDSALRIRNLLKADMTEYHNSIKTTKLLKAILKTYTNNNQKIPDTLITNIMYYGIAVERSQKEGFLNPALRRNSVKALKGIMDELGLNPEKKVNETH